MLDANYVIKFVVKEQNSPKEIHRRLKTVSSDGARKRTQVYWWVLEVQRGHEDVSDSPRLERPPDIGTDEILAHRLGRDPRAMVRKLAYLLEVSP
jgi:hypothetical protein